MGSVNSRFARQLIDRLLFAPDEGSAYQIISQNRDLLSPTCQPLIEKIVGYYDKRKWQRAGDYLAVRIFLQGCQRLGVETAVASQINWPLQQHNAIARAYVSLDSIDFEGIVHHQMGIVYLEQANVGDVTSRKLGIQCFETAVSLWTKTQSPIAKKGLTHARINLASLYLHHTAIRRQDSIKQAFHALNQVEANPKSSYYPQYLVLNGVAYLYTTEGERLYNIEKGIAYFEDAFKYISQQQTTFRLEVQHNLAVAYRRRLRGDASLNIETALHFEESVFVNGEKRSEPWARSALELATIYALRQEGVPANNIEEAIGYAEQSLELYMPQSFPQKYAEAKMILGNLYCDRLEGNPAKNFLTAIAHFNDVFEVRSKKNNPIGWAEVKNNLGTAYAALASQAEDVLYNKAVSNFQDALDVYKQDYLPERTRKAATNLGHFAFRFQRWEQAYQAYTKAISANRNLFLASSTESGRRYELAEVSGVAGSAAYCLLRQENPDPEQAFLVLERGKTQQLVEALTLTEFYMLQHPHSHAKVLIERLRELRSDLRLGDLMPQKEFLTKGEDSAKLQSEIRKILAMSTHELPDELDDIDDVLRLIPETAVLIAPAVTQKGTAIFIIRGSDTAIDMTNIHWIHDFTTDHLQALLFGTKTEAGWIPAYRQKLTQGVVWWQTQLDRFLPKLWDAFMESLTICLADLSIPKDTTLMFMPQGGLSLLPLHSAGYKIDDKWHYFIDDYTVTYVPSIALLAANEEKLSIHTENQTLSLLSVMQPETKGKNGTVSRLPNAQLEATAVASCFTNTTLLHNEQATPKATKTQMPAHDYLHFICHGTYDWSNVMKSGLLLANDEMISLHDVLELILPNPRLITLSACETGIPEVNQSPDEYIGLPGGFLQAGVRGILSTLWTVSDSGSAIFMAYFYEKHIKEQLPPAVALRQTQVWLRNSNPQKIQAYFQQRIENGEVDLFPLFIESMKRPLQHPYFWAAFTFTGN